MLNKCCLFPLFILGCLAILGYFIFTPKSSFRLSFLSPSPSSFLVHSSHFYTTEAFEKIFERNKGIKLESRVYGGILPHHLIAADIIASFFQGIKDQAVETLVLLGPNHRNFGEDNISISKAQWQTPYGWLEPDFEVIGRLLEEGVVHQNEALFEEEHSIYRLTPFIKKVFPQARIVPLALKSYTPPLETKKFGLELAKVCHDKCLIVASVDFSHDVPREVAFVNDRQSLKTIKSFNLDELYSLETDSNPSLYTLLTYLGAKEAWVPILLTSTNSAEITKKLSAKTVTSYMSFYFTDSVSLDLSLSLEQIFSLNHSGVEKLPPGEIFTLVATGDVGLVRDVNFQMVKRNDFSYPFEKTAAVLKEADLTLINLEGPLISNCPLTHQGMVFCGDARGVEGLVSAGVDLANLVNNHGLDYGQKGLLETVEVLTQNSLAPVVPEGTAVKEVRGRKFAFLGFEDINRKIEIEEMEKQIKQAKVSAEVVIVSFHWGREYTAFPTQRQKDLAHLAIDSGADLIIGHHPHWIQSIEIYKERLIVYSHGNFIFDQLWSQKTREGVIGEYTFYEDKLIEARFLPIFINDTYQPYLLEGEEKERVLESMEEASRKPWSIQEGKATNDLVDELHRICCI